MLYVFCLYGITGGHQDATAAGRTDDILQATFLEAKQHPDGPAIIAIDLNADTADIPTLSDALDSHTWIDVGAHAAAWGRPSSDFTCIAPNTLAPTRRDYIFANRQAFEIGRASCRERV